LRTKAGYFAKRSGLKGLSRNGLYIESQIEFYYLFLKYSDDKVKPVKPFPLYPQILEGLTGGQVGRLEFAEVREDGEPSRSSLRTYPIKQMIYFS
jgi:hypothetical protein